MTATTDLNQAPAYDGITYVIPCGGAKLDHAAPARDLYTGQMFRHTLENAERTAQLDTEELGRPARVLILSAKYGLVELDQVLEPYDLRMGATGSVTAETLAEQALALGIDWGSEVYGMLPRPYLARLDEALRTLDVYIQDSYEACGGIGEQRRVNVIASRPTAPTAPADAEADGPGPTVWIGGDVSAFWWGTPILVSYGRLRAAKTLPVATAPWVLDSRAFVELGEHGRWTIPAAEYAADVTRYATEVGRLEWAAPQDWPAAPHLLERTGLTEAEHQRRTIASVQELRAAGTGVPIICVVTGPTPEAYLRHVEMYRRAGIDLRAEQLVVGVGALVFRPPAEAAQIVRVLHAAGLHRLHAFGGKGRLLDEVGGLLESVDSAGWSAEARRRGGLCPHGLVKWERNCPRAAQGWAAGQRERAARAQVQPLLPMFDLAPVGALPA